MRTDPNSTVAGDIGYRIDVTSYGTYAITVLSVAGVAFPPVKVYETTNRAIAYGVFDALDSDIVSKVERGVMLALTRIADDSELSEMTATHPGACQGEFCPDATCKKCEAGK